MLRIILYSAERTWNSTRTHPPPSSKHVMVAQGTRLVVALGEQPSDRIFIYDTCANAWLQATIASGAPHAPPLQRALA